MTLDEAIKHCEEKAEELRKQASIGLDSMDDTIRVERCKECAEEYEQLAEWLKQLREVKKIVDEWDNDIFAIQTMKFYYFDRIVEVFKEVKKNDKRK